MRNVYCDVICVVDERVDLNVVCFGAGGGEELFVPKGESAFVGEGGRWLDGESGGVGGGEEDEY